MTAAGTKGCSAADVTDVGIGSIALLGFGTQKRSSGA